MRLVCISDTHTLHTKLKLPEGDVLIHAGDALNYGRKEELFVFSKWWNALDYKKKLFVPGNHDWCFERDESWSRQMLLDTSVLIDQGIVIDGVTFYGTPWQRRFCDWAFNRDAEDRRYKFSHIPVCDVLISHAPPLGFCDEGFYTKNERLGDEELLAATADKIPAIHICGHIHYGYGRQGRASGTVYNVAICSEQYKPTNAVTVIDL